VDWDDESRLFLITFGEEPPQRQPIGEWATTALPEEEPFVVFDASQGRGRVVRDGPDQQRFKFAVLKRY
jgi:hypothetical protein